MKILVVCQYYYPEPFRISDICETLVEKGHDVTVLTGLPNYPEGQVLDDYRYGRKRNEMLNGVKVIRSFEIGRGNSKLRLFLNYLSFAVSGSMRAFFMDEKYDVVLVNQLSPVLMGIPAIVYKRKHKKKILLYCLDLWPDSLAAGGIKESSVVYKFFKKLSKWVYSSADSIAVTSSMFKEYFRDTLKVSKKEIHHIPQYAEDLFTESIEVPKNDKFNFVFAGNIGDMQSVETIVKAANELRNHTNIIIHIVGDGSKLEECKLLSKQMKLDNIIYYGRKPVSEMPYYYGLADAMLITLKNNKAISYTLPGKMQSYMAACKPIIGAINGEASHVIREANCGLCCAAEDYKELANLLIDFCNSDKKDEMAKCSYDYYISNYSKERFISLLENTLTNMEE
ncbi:glycosyltransferase family 4 protein [Solibacillus isronensis]|uniref:glycosyltransferase family 4 protein n=1 Tax=Solibacillus isronensis TaxID=412383 RepID=UPI00203F3266|nr:glycosyltransferase family 4 protein [Solibacillus isronensis]MCM3722110.1 glycosyltransferase family 4 protein [Solibacillus isronensis]